MTQKYVVGVLRSWLRPYAKSRKVAGSIPDEVIGLFSVDLILPVTLWPWGRLSLLTEMSTRNFPGVKGWVAGA
jgi:hypothetical protein